ncbi:MAG: 50S ribosomal protein L11 methyltransferase [Bacillota bacterium]
MEWLEVSVSCSRELEEAVCAALYEAGADGVAVYTHEGTEVRGYFGSEKDLSRLRRAIENLPVFFPFSRRPYLRVKTLDEADWANAWKEYYDVTHIGERTVVVPSWRSYQRKPGEIVILLDPGMAFGTGTHPTTIMVIEELERRVRRGMRVLDIGTGSGILAAAAAVTGAEVVAIDKDEVAVRVARENMKKNEVDNRVELYHGTLETYLARHAPLPFDLVLANITANVIASLFEPVCRCLGPNGLFITSGIIASRVPVVMEAARESGFQTVFQREMSDWMLLAFSRRGG